MGSFLKGILGGFEGLVGTVVGTTWKDQDIMKSRSKKSKKAPVQEQIDQRNIFKMMVKFLTFLKDIVDIGYKSQDTSMTPMNAAMSYNLQNAVVGISPVFSIDFSQVVISVGARQRATVITVAAEPGDVIKVDWEYTKVKTASMTDTDLDDAFIIFFNAQDEMYNFEIVKRSVGTVSLTFPRRWQGDDLHGWLFFVSPDGKKASKSQYIGKVATIA